MTQLQQGVGEAAMIKLQLAAGAYLNFLQANRVARIAAETARHHGVPIPDPFGVSVPAVDGSEAGELAQRLVDTSLVGVPVSFVVEVSDQQKHVESGT
jgi:hypothetical protein